MNSNVMKAKYCRIVYFQCFYLRNTTELPEKAILYQVGFTHWFGVEQFIVQILC